MPSTELRGGLENEPLAPLTTFGIGGRARWLLNAFTMQEVERAHQWSASAAVPLCVVGGGSNLVVADEGFPGVVLRVAIRGLSVAAEGGDTLVTVGAGESWDETVADCVGRGLAGLECLSGIPGTVGGTPVQNVGAYGQEVSTSIDRVTAYDCQSRRFRTLSADECAFSYRTSRFKGTEAHRFVICDVTFRLRAGGPTVNYPDIVDYLVEAGASSPGILDVRNAVLAVRRRKGMVIDPADPDTRSVGSFFMNPIVSAQHRERVAFLAEAQPPVYPADSDRVKLSAAWLIERSGFRRGDADGPVGISTKHTLALVNRGGATARDVLTFASRVKRGVLDRFGISLRPEPVFVGFERNHELNFLLNE